MFATLVLSSVLIMSSCNESSPPENSTQPSGDSSKVEDIDDIVPNNEDAFAVSSEKYSANGSSYDIYYYEVSPDELVDKINIHMKSKGYPEFILKDNYIATVDSGEDSYYYYAEGKKGKLTVNTHHNMDKVSTVYIQLYDSSLDEYEINMSLAAVESMVETFAPGQGKSIPEELELYNISPESEYDYRETDYGSSTFKLSVPDEFTILPIDA